MIGTRFLSYKVRVIQSAFESGSFALSRLKREGSSGSFLIEEMRDQVVSYWESRLAHSVSTSPTLVRSKRSPLWVKRAI